MGLHIVVLAAGQGKRMHSALPKVLQPLGDRPLLKHVVEAGQALDPDRIHVVYGHGAEQVQSALDYLDVNWVFQEQQLGTGHAVAQAIGQVPEDAQVLVLYGDVPLIRPATLSHLIGTAGRASLALLTVVLDDPNGYGRIQRDDDNKVVGIVEDKDASADERHIREINTGLMCAQAKHLRDWLARLTNDNTQGEYYLTDCIAMATADGVSVVAGQSGTIAETQGINDKLDLARAERLLQRRQADALMAQGLTLRDPERFDLRGALHAGPDSMIDVNVVVEGDVELGSGVRIGPGCVLRNCRIDDHTEVLSHSVIEHAQVGARCQIGPFARLRPDTRVGDRAKIGNFVETKKIRLGNGSKINHLSYVGDASIGDNVNVGAGVITCNYDGANKHVTTIGDDAFIGSDSQLVAPVSVESGATIGAGSTITKTAPTGTLTLSRTRQITVPSWKRPKKDNPGHD